MYKYILCKASKQGYILWNIYVIFFLLKVQIKIWNMIKNVNLLMPGGGVVGRSEKIKKKSKAVNIWYM